MLYVLYFRLHFGNAECIERKNVAQTLQGNIYIVLGLIRLCFAENYFYFLHFTQDQYVISGSLIVVGLRLLSSLHIP